MSVSFGTHIALSGPGRLEITRAYSADRPGWMVGCRAHDRIDAHRVFDGPVYAEIFRTYVEKVLVPALRYGDIVTRDNLGSHEAAAVRSVGARLWFLSALSRSSRASNAQITSAAQDMFP